MRTERIIIRRVDLDHTPAGRDITHEVDLTDTQAIYDVKVSPNRRYLTLTILEEPTVTLGGSPNGPQEPQAASSGDSEARGPEGSLLAVLEAVGVDISATEQRWYDICADWGLSTRKAVQIWGSFMLSEETGTKEIPTERPVGVKRIPLPGDLIPNTPFTLSVGADNSARITQIYNGETLAWTLLPTSNTWVRFNG